MDKLQVLLRAHVADSIYCNETSCIASSCRRKNIKHRRKLKAASSSTKHGQWRLHAHLTNKSSIVDSGIYLTMYVLIAVPL
uniref:Uncharacterized protein n=1 Tax=Cannabis sativa TaxID=3483 RepID=A0A803QRK1_CANSA